MKTALITGTTGAIGKAVARLIAEKQDYRIVFVARNESKAENTVRELREKTGTNNISFLLADLSRRQEIISMAENFKSPVHLLINLAGTTPRQRLETPEGIELQWATNVLGYFRMIKYFLPHLKEGAPARIVNVVSYWAGNLDLNDPEFKTRRYDNDTAYHQSKQAERKIDELAYQLYGLTEEEMAIVEKEN